MEQAMRQVGKMIDAFFNPTKDTDMGFVLLAFPYDGDEGAKISYISNGLARKEAAALFRELADKFEVEE